MILKFLAAVLAFILTVLGFGYADAHVSGLVVAIVAFIAAYIAFKYAPSDL